MKRLNLLSALAIVMSLCACVPPAADAGPPTVTSLTFMTPDGGRYPIASDGAVIVTNRFNTEIVATDAKSYQVWVNGAGPREEGSAPFNTHGEGLVPIQPGTHEVKVVPFAEPSAKGKRGEPLIIRFEVKAPGVVFGPAPVPGTPINLALIDVNGATGNDANDGRAGKAVKTVQRGVDLAQPGDVVRIAKGVYREAVVVKNGGTKDKPIQIVGSGKLNAEGIPVPDVTFDGGQKLDTAINMHKAGFVHVQWVEARNYFSGYGPDRSAIVMGPNGRLSNSLSTLNIGGGVGIPGGGDNVHLIRVAVIKNALDGLHGGRLKGMYWEDTFAYDNGFGHALNAERAKASPDLWQEVTPGVWGKRDSKESQKFSQTDGFTAVRHTAKRNRGHDLWLDIGHVNTTLIDPDIDRFAYELSRGPLIVKGGRGHIGFWCSGRYSLDKGKTWINTQSIIENHTFDVLDTYINKTPGFTMELRQMTDNRKEVPVDPKNPSGPQKPNPDYKTNSKRGYYDHWTGQWVNTEFGPIAIINSVFIKGAPHTDGEMFRGKTPSQVGVELKGNTYPPGVHIAWGGYVEWIRKEIDLRKIDPAAKFGK